MILDKALILDGGMGGLLLERSGKHVGYLPERLNIELPEVVLNAHKEYIASGSDVVYTNTFGANEYKFGEDLDEIISAGVALANRAKAEADKVVYTALDIGSLGKIVGEGGISFDEAYAQFVRIIQCAKDKTDIIVLETFTDLCELRAAVLAATENSSLPVVASMSFGVNGRTAFGNSVESFAVTISGLGVSAIGINCSLGPVEMLPLAKRLLACTRLPVFIKPNAGMPHLEHGKTVYDINEDAFAQAMANIKRLGISILGGCCGTTPKYIAKIVEICGKIKVDRQAFVERSVVCSATSVVFVDEPKIVGERINPTGKKVFQQALREGDYDYILRQGVLQSDEGADILDVNVGINGIDEKAAMLTIVKGLARTCDLPLQIDSSNPEVIECALRAYNGKAIVNSVNGKRESIKAVLPLVKRYGAAVVALTLDEEGIPPSVEARLDIAKRIVDECEKYGIPKCDIYVDTLTMAEAAEKGNAQCTLGALKLVKELGVRSVLGISNVSFGMPNREDINAKFLELAKQNGLDLCIINPKLKNIVGSDYAYDFLMARDGAVDAYIAYASEVSESAKAYAVPQTNDMSLDKAILFGQSQSVVQAVTKLLETKEPLDIIAQDIIPALDEVGRLYEEGKTFFLPQLIAAAGSAKCGFDILNAALEKSGYVPTGKTFVLATVKGDIHDIGKNIVKAVVSNYGYRVVDLGRDVDYERVLEAVRDNYPCVLGLSALMTTTAENMATTIRLVRNEFKDIPILVGGAVLTPEYAKSIGGIYCKDANETVQRLKAL